MGAQVREKLRDGGSAIEAPDLEVVSKDMPRAAVRLMPKGRKPSIAAGGCERKANRQHLPGSLGALWR